MLLSTLVNLFKEIKTDNNIIDYTIEEFNFFFIFDKDIVITMNNIENKSNVIAIYYCKQYLIICFDVFYHNFYIISKFNSNCKLHYN